MIPLHVSTALSVMILPLVIAPKAAVDGPFADPVPERPRPSRPSSPRALKGLAAALVGGIPLPPGPRPGSGRERHLRREQAKRIAKDTGLDVERVYQALGRGETEGEIRQRSGGQQPTDQATRR